MKLISLLKIFVSTILIAIVCQSVYAGYYIVAPSPQSLPMNLNPAPERGSDSYAAYYESYYDENDFDQDLRTDDDVGRELEIN